MRKILVIAAAGAVLAVGGTTAALAQSGADDGTQVPATAVSEPSASTSAGTETTRSSEVTESPSVSRPAPSTYPTRTHDLGDDHGGHGAEPGDDHGRHHEAGDDHGGHLEPGDDHGGRR
jgi:hypothetical protein